MLSGCLNITPRIYSRLLYSVFHRHPKKSAISGYFWYPKSWNKAISHGSLLKTLWFNHLQSLLWVIVPWTIYWCIIILPAIGLPFGGISVYNPISDLTLAWTQRSIMTQPRTLVVGSVHLKLWWLNIVKVKKRPGPTIGAPQELVYGKSMHHAHNCSVAKFNPKGSGNQNRIGRVRNRKARPDFQVPK